MKKILIGAILGFLLSMSLRTVHSLAFNYYFNQCDAELSGLGVEFNPVDCANKKMGYLNLISTVSGFPMYMLDRWEWFG